MRRHTDDTTAEMARLPRSALSAPPRRAPLPLSPSLPAPGLHLFPSPSLEPRALIPRSRIPPISSERFAFSSRALRGASALPRLALQRRPGHAHSVRRGPCGRSPRPLTHTVAPTLNPRPAGPAPPPLRPRRRSAPTAHLPPAASSSSRYRSHLRRDPRIHASHIRACTFANLPRTLPGRRIAGPPAPPPSLPLDLPAPPPPLSISLRRLPLTLPPDLPPVSTATHSLTGGHKPPGRPASESTALILPPLCDASPRAWPDPVSAADRRRGTTPKEPQISGHSA